MVNRSITLWPARIGPLTAAALLLTACGGGGGAGAGGPSTPAPAGGSGPVVTTPAPDPKINDLAGPVKEMSVILTEGTNMAAAPSPDGKQVAFTNQGVLWIVPITGGQAKRLSTWNMEATYPVWAPDGSRIAFQNYDVDGNYHIWTIKPDGSDAQRITSGFFDDREPSWSADGSSLVFASDRGGDQQYKIWVYTLASDSYRQLTKGNGAESHPSLSPDGRKLLFVENTTNPGVYQLDLTTGQIASLGAGSTPTWSPAGDAVVRTTTGGLDLGGKTAAAGERIFPFPVRWLADGRFLYTADGKIRIRSADGASASEVPFSASLALRRPIFTKKDHGFGDLGHRVVKGIVDPVLSPDGSKVAFVALNNIWVMDVASKTAIQLTDSTDAKEKPGWRKDGASVYFATDKDGGGFLSVDQVNISTRARTRLAGIAGVTMEYPTLSPSESQLAFWTGNGRLETFDIDSKTRTPILAPVQGAGISRPSWSPDGSKVVVTDALRVNNRFREGYNKIRVINIGAKTGTWFDPGPLPLVIADRGDAGPVWSPDGKWMAFVADAVLQIIPVNGDGAPTGPATALTTEAADMPSWSSDSRYIVYMASGKLRRVDIGSRSSQDITPTIQYQQAAAEGITIIRANVWNGISGSVAPNLDVVISGNRIVAIEPVGTRPTNTATRFIDATGKTLIPGMWEGHVHSLYFGQEALGVQLAETLAWGFTSAYSMGNYLYQDIQLREALEAGKLTGPRLFASTLLLDGVRVNYPSSRAVRNEQVAELELAKAKAMGVDGLKSYVRSPIPIMSLVARTAQEMGIPSYSHFMSPGVSTGQYGSSHLSATERMGYGWSSTSAYQDVIALRTQGEFNMVATSGSAENAPLVAAKSIVSIGSDLPLVRPGRTANGYLTANAAKVGNYEAMRMATINGAINAFAERDLGTIEVGKIADLVVLDGNPLDDITATTRVLYVAKNGRVMTPTEIRAPFTTPQLLTQRRQALFAQSRLCAKDHHLCGGLPVHAH